MDVTIAVSTFGDQSWVDLAHSRAIPSAERQGARVVYSHGDTLAKARNQSLEKVNTEFVIHLDADDELAPGYVEAMATGTEDLRAPQLQQIGRRRHPRIFMPQVWGHEHGCVGECLRYGNYIVIGACVRADLLREVGGWEEWGWSEDWALWARCWKAGATVETIRDAVYIAHVRQGSRNHALPADQTMDWHRAIEQAIWPEEVTTT